MFQHLKVKFDGLLVEVSVNESFAFFNKKETKWRHHILDASFMSYEPFFMPKTGICVGHDVDDLLGFPRT